MLPGAGFCHGVGMAKTPSLKVLVVDDHAAFRHQVRQMFDGMDAAITEAASGEEALQLFTADAPDWVVMDLRMPGMGGLKATEAIHRLDPAARIVMMSQFNEPEYAEQARTVGAFAFINKEELFRLPQIVRSERPSVPQSPLEP
jgi:CheY-like chemotaxis protein